MSKVLKMRPRQGQVEEIARSYAERAVRETIEHMNTYLHHSDRTTESFRALYEEAVRHTQRMMLECTLDLVNRNDR